MDKDYWERCNAWRKERKMSWREFLMGAAELLMNPPPQPAIVELAEPVGVEVSKHHRAKVVKGQAPSAPVWGNDDIGIIDLIRTIDSQGIVSGEIIA